MNPAMLSAKMLRQKKRSAVQLEDSKSPLNDHLIGAGRKLQIMEDNLVNMKIATKIAVQLGFKIIASEDGHEGMQHYHQYAPDIILLDLHMPRKDGAQVLDDIRRKDSVTPVIIVSADSSDETRKDLLAKGANDFLLKPFRQADLIAVIERM